MVWMLWLVVVLAGCTQKPQYPKVYEFRFVTQGGVTMSFLCLHNTRANMPSGTYECDLGERLRLGE